MIVYSTTASGKRADLRAMAQTHKDKGEEILDERILMAVVLEVSLDNLDDNFKLAVADS
jgi:hypothetical protein